MAWPKTSRELSALLEEALLPFPVHKRMMFGGPSFFVNGNMLAGVHGDSLIVRLSEVDRESIQASHSEAGPFEVRGRAMKEYVVLPPSVYDDPAKLGDWLRRSIEYVSSLPPKEPKPRKPKS